MIFKHAGFRRINIPTMLALIFLVGLSGCESSSSDDDSGIGYIQLYNASANAPGIYLSVDKIDDDDFIERIEKKVEYGFSSKYLEYSNDIYDIDLSWRHDDNADDLKSIYQDSLTVSEDSISFLVVTDDIAFPEILRYDVPKIQDDDDITDNLFNIRFLNLHPGKEAIDIYLSESDETFNEAELLGQHSYANLSDNSKLAQDEYIFYITTAGSDEILFQSDGINYSNPIQYIMIIRESEGAGSSPYTLDKVSNVTTQYADSDAESQFRVYNGIVEHELLPNYLGQVDLHIDGIDESAEFSSLTVGEFSSSYATTFGDYNIALTVPATDEIIINNHLLTLEPNSDKTMIFYLLEEEVDNDGDGQVDEIRVTVNSLVVENSQSQSIYSHQIKIVNLVDDFDYIKFYFVKNNEVIDTAQYSKSTTYLKTSSLTLINNTYSIYAIGNEYSSDLILAQFDITLDEDTRDLFLIIEEDSSSQTGYKMKFNNQKD